MKYKNMFSEMALKGITFPNRLQRTSMVSGLATEDGQVTKELKARYQREARGGVGSIVVEAAVVLPSRSSYNLRISDDSLTDGLKDLVAGIREANPETKLGIQIMHFLKIARSGWRQKVTDFKPEDLPVIVQQHADAARRALSAGFDFIELHLAHAYTLSSFLSLSNQRKDKYGGGLKNRMRLPIEVYEAIRGVVGGTSRFLVPPCSKAHRLAKSLPNWVPLTSVSQGGVGLKMRFHRPKTRLLTPCQDIVATG
jgi:2,4-dienoyl-CoA reductase-like NADH-dependent reductase (Old Yellow Enzyme family)